ncbi:Oidioi.mRNA.OKI2018_I69.chr2.g4707.t1.cds [Oikopleura dioica]|uniref:Oidioi.mRNA.OKI2018_I69.chr2.g4707.t1.cds n=1 Tax=Oikopleura dioica TaxID=34765 RepID=A0ABN7T2G4_OIKDI|nr:Oidioi.mRNA.OKI2018_I69.chr2.g4707.t1.cds [Oikopleura dioica]
MKLFSRILWLSAIVSARGLINIFDIDESQRNVPAKPVVPIHLASHDHSKLMAHLKENASFKKKMTSFTNRLSGDLNQLREIDDPDTREKVAKLTNFLTHFQQFL